MKKFIIFSAIVIMGVFLWAIYENTKVEVKENTTMGLLQPNRKAPLFTLPDINTGNPVSLEQFRGKIVVLNFWSSWCTPCQEEVKELNRFYEDFRDSVVLLGINVWDDKGKALSFMKKYGINFPVLHAKNSPITVDYGINGVPETVIIDSTGVIRFHFKGPITYEILGKYTEKALHG